MIRGLSLRALSGIGRRASAALPGPLPDRPRGPLVWVQCPDPARLGLVAALADRIAAEGDWLHMLVTSDDIPADADPGTRTLHHPTPPEEPEAIRAALAHWRPDVVLWFQGDLRPLLLDEMGDVPRILVDAEADLIRLSSRSWVPGLLRRIASGFDIALAVDQAAADRLYRAGLAPERVEVTGPLDTSRGVLACNEAERRNFVQLLAARPVWLAAGVALSELGAVIAAHRQASRSAHRLLLILAPRMAEDAAEMARALTEAGLAVALRSEGSEPEADTQVFLADGQAELGLWYRLAPVTFMGGTLSPEGNGRHPFEAASLGSAVLHGPGTLPHPEAYARLDRARAAWPLRTAADLGQAVEVLLAPDRAAAMAHAAWDVVTTGAEVGNRLIDILRERLDRAAG
ncbi:MAG: 3-deoxy-D-manno-octulosonic acid transferase [Rubellimicrobium sp.]|nr:3-deoxy-D-manno-octulosonic acid transferase [Rubellimicrobium sp.]